jgi:hypothetical protein
MHSAIIKSFGKRGFETSYFIFHVVYSQAVRQADDEPYGKPEAHRLVNISKIGQINPLTDGFRRIASRGSRLSNEHILEHSTQS